MYCIFFAATRKRKHLKKLVFAAPRGSAATERTTVIREQKQIVAPKVIVYSKTERLSERKPFQTQARMIESGKKRRKVSKKKKISWRKHVDTTDVDAYLDNTRLEERLGVPFAERSDNDLFVVDVKPCDAEATATKSKRERRLALQTAEPRCLAALKPHTAVADPIAKRNRVRSAQERKNPITRRLERERKLSGKLNLTERLAAKNKASAETKRSTRPKRGEFDVDIWERACEPLPQVDASWLTSDTVRHVLANQGTKKKRVPIAVRQKPSAVAAVSIPHPGTSYNPSYEDHQSLLREVAENEIQAAKEEARLNRATCKMFQKVTPEQRDRNWLNESSEGLPSKSDSHKDDDGGDDQTQEDVKCAVKRAVKNNKKTLVQRRKQKEQRKLSLSIKHAKVEKKKISDIYKLRALEKHLAAQQGKIEMLREKRRKNKEKKAVEPKTLSRVKFEPADPVFKLSEELAGNLRNSEPVGSLLTDRFKSLQQRSIVAPSTRVAKLNKARVKRFVKPDHKMEWEKNG